MDEEHTFSTTIFFQQVIMFIYLFVRIFYYVCNVFEL